MSLDALHTNRKYDHVGKQLFEGNDTWTALWEIFRDTLQDPNLKHTYLMIDALDECDPNESKMDLPRLWDMIVQHSSTSRVRWILSSRNRHAIEQQLMQDESRAKLNPESNEEQVSSAVDAYIDHQVSELAPVRDGKALQDQLRDQMRQTASGTSLWVALVFQELQKVERRNVLQVVKQAPIDLIALYDQNDDADSTIQTRL